MSIQLRTDCTLFLLLCLLGTGLVFPAAAQTIKGTVTGKDGQLPGATVRARMMVRGDTIAVNLRQKEIDSQTPGGRKSYQRRNRLINYWVRSKQCFQPKVFTVQPLGLDSFNGSQSFPLGCF